MVALRQPLTLAECQQIRVWRNAPDVFPMLRSGYVGFWKQTWFWCKQRAPWPPRDHEWYAVMNHGDFVGVTGLTYLHHVIGEAEISLVLGPLHRGDGIGTRSVDLILQEAWRRNLRTVTGECYPDGAVKFWRLQAFRYGVECRLKPVRRPSHDPAITHSWQWAWHRP